MLRIENVAPEKGLLLLLGRKHWTDAFPPPFEEKAGRLATAIRAMFAVDFEGARLGPQAAELGVDDAKPADKSSVEQEGVSTEGRTDAAPPLDSTPLPEPTEEARSAVRQALAQIVAKIGTSWGSQFVESHNCARVWPQLAGGEILPVAAALLEVLDDPSCAAHHRWKVVELLRYAIRTPAGRGAARSIAERVAQHLGTTGYVQETISGFVDCCPIPAQQKWQILVPVLATITGRSWSAVGTLAEKFCPASERDRLCDIMLGVLEYEEASILSVPYSVLAKQKYVKGFGRLRELARFADLTRAYYACRLLSELGDTEAGPAMREAIANQRYTDNANVAAILQFLYGLEKTAAVPLVSEVLSEGGKNLQVSFMNSGTGHEDPALRELVKQLADQAADEGVRNAGAKYLAGG